jgi:DNA-binding transcriptional regulator YdaS (Cro superfamily)
MATKYNPITNEPIKKLTLRTWGLQGKIAKRTGLSAPIVNLVFTGKRRATPDVAAKMEEAFIHYGIDITRNDLIWGVKPGQSLIEYMDERREEGRA